MKKSGCAVEREQTLLQWSVFSRGTAWGRGVYIGTGNGSKIFGVALGVLFSGNSKKEIKLNMMDLSIDLN